MKGARAKSSRSSSHAGPSQGRVQYRTQHSLAMGGKRFQRRRATLL
jgi:hypothetical protein